MSDEGYELILVLRNQIKERLRAQINRHAKIDPHFNIDKIVDIQMEEEKDKLDRIRVEFEDKEQYNICEYIESLVEALPELVQEVRSTLRG